MTDHVTLDQYYWLHCLKQAPSPHHLLLVTSAKYPQKQFVRG